tara:strand:+ start:2200 stop:2382 length:183 start_codon:yes stop_codon:yes gene_type:complete
MTKIIIINDTEHGRFEVQLKKFLAPALHVTYKENLQRAVDFARGYRMHTEGLEDAEIIIK